MKTMQNLSVPCGVSGIDAELLTDANVRFEQPLEKNNYVLVKDETPCTRINYISLDDKTARKFSFLRFCAHEKRRTFKTGDV